MLKTTELSPRNGLIDGAVMKNIKVRMKPKNNLVERIPPKEYQRVTKFLNFMYRTNL